MSLETDFGTLADISIPILAWWEHWR